MILSSISIETSIRDDGFWVVAKDTGETEFVYTPLYTGPDRVWVKSFDGVGDPLSLLENEIRKLNAPENKPTQKTGRPPNSRDNSICYQALHEYFNLEIASSVYQFIDDIFIGVSKLDWGGTRGLVPENLFILLSSMQVITSDLVRDLTWCSDRHSRNLALALRICAEAFERAYCRFVVQSEDLRFDYLGLEVQEVGEGISTEDLEWYEFLSCLPGA